MNILQKRFFGFLLACIPLRLLFVYIAKNISIGYLPYLGLVAVIPAIGFLIIYFGGANTFIISLIGILIMSTISIFSSIIANKMKSV